MDTQAIRAEPNVTPMIDVMLVLLIIFMAVAPMIAGGFPATPPRGTHLASHPDDATDTVLGIDLAGNYYLNKAPVSESTLVLELSSRLRLRPDDHVIYLRADKDLPYRRVQDAMALAVDAGARGWAGKRGTGAPSRPPDRTVRDFVPLTPNFSWPRRLAAIVALLPMAGVAGSQQIARTEAGVAPIRDAIDSARAPAAYAGCYTVRRGAWPRDVGPAYRIPAIVHLDTAPKDHGQFRLSPDIAYPRGNTFAGAPAWSVRRDTVWLVWSNGFSVTRVFLRRVGSTLSGIATAQGDSFSIGDPPLPQIHVTLKRTSCEPDAATTRRA